MTRKTLVVDVLEIVFLIEIVPKMVMFSLGSNGIVGGVGCKGGVLR